MNRDIPPAASKKPLLLHNREEYLEFLKTLEFTDAYGKLIEPDYESIIPPDYEFPILIIWAGELMNEPPIMRPISLN